MWYAFVEISSDYHMENRIFFGNERKGVAAKLDSIDPEKLEFFRKK